MRLLKHPGRPTQPRRVIAAGRSFGEWRITLPAGTDLVADLGEILAARGTAQAALQLLSGGFSTLRYQGSEPNESGGRVAVYGAARSLEGTATLIGGSGLLGRDEGGWPQLDCHALLVDAEGRLVGGRLLPGCRVADEGLVVLVAGLAEAGFVATYDEETDATLFQPVKGSA